MDCIRSDARQSFPCMETYNGSLATRFERVLARRDNELRAILRLTGGLADEAPGRRPRDVFDFEDSGQAAA